jgi:hypothetical protein
MDSVNRGVVLSDEDCLRVISRLSLAFHEKHIPWSAQNQRHQNLLINQRPRNQHSISSHSIRGE